MAYKRKTGIRKVADEIREEAAYQLRPFPREFRRQLTRGWGKEVFRQLFGPPPRYYRGR